MKTQLRYLNANYDLFQMEQQVDQFTRNFKEVHKNLDLQKQDLFNPMEIQNTLVELKKNGEILVRVLEANLHSYAPTSREKNDTYAQGSYGRLKGSYLALIKKLRGMTPHLNVLIEANKAAQNTNAKTAFVAKELFEHRTELSDKGLKEFGDGLSALLLLAILIQRFLAKNKSYQS